MSKPSKPKQEIDATNFDLDLCFLSGVSFFQIASAFFEKLPTDENEAARFALNQRGGLFVAATNLALAIELLLKALAIARKRKVVPDHTLVTLFDALPLDYQQSIEYLYGQEIRRPVAPHCIAVRLYISPVGVPVQQGPSEAVKKEGVSVRSVLEAESDALKLWRYMHEAGDPAACVQITTLHYHLRVIGSAIIKHFALDPSTHRIAKTVCHSAPGNNR